MGKVPVFLQVALCSLFFLAVAGLELSPALQKQLDNAQKFAIKGKHAANNVQASGDTKCILCGIVVNELQGMLAENLTESELMAFLKKDVCALVHGEIAEDCDSLVDLVPIIVKEIESGSNPGVVCVKHDYCEQPFYELPDLTPVPIYKIDLDKFPEDRWTEVCSNETYKAVMGGLIHALEDFFENSTAITELGRLLNLFYYPSEYAGEIRGCAKALDVDYGWLTFVNLGYEVSDLCTSIVAQTTSGQILHARNMDFWDGIWLTNHLKNLTFTAEYTRLGKTVFYATTFAGYVGVLSGMKPNGFSITLNTRDYPQGIGQLFYEIIAAIKEKNASLVSFLTREVMTRENNFEAAVENLSNGVLIADVYYIVGGVSQNQGAVITRNRTHAEDVWRLNAANGTWHLVQTNYDHWKRPPWFDDRVVPATNGMNALGQANLSLEGILKVLSIKPVLNLQSTFAMLSSATDGTFKSYMRNCPYPCAE